MKKYKVLVTAEVIKDKLETLSSSFDFIYDGYSLNHDVMAHDELIKKIGDYDILICEYDTISKDVIDAAKKLSMIICCRGGVGSVIDLEYATKKGIIVCNNPGRNADSAANLVFGYIIDLTRNITKTNGLIHNKVLVGDKSTKPCEYKDTVWGLDNDSPFIKYRGDSLNHMSLGIVGYGNVGKLLAKKANFFGMKVLVYDPFINQCFSKELGLKFVSFDELLEKSDVVSVHCSLNKDTKNLFSEKAFEKMKKGSYFINTSRGEIVDEISLAKYLKNGHLKGAAIDVTINEPIHADSELLELDNLIITPHIAGSSIDVQYVGTNMVIDSLMSFIKRERPQHAVVFNGYEKNK